MGPVCYHVTRAPQSAKLSNMRRRSVLKTALALPAAAIPAAPQSPAQASESPTPKLEALSPDAAAAGVPRFFTPTQLSSLNQLADLLMPAFNANPSATQAGVAEFLDFYIASSDAATQQLWHSGLDRLAKELAARAPDVALAPLKQPWTYNGPTEPFAKFLLSARDLVLQATVNSREWSESGGGRRRSAGVNYFWRNLG
jgi:hypothetical protein